MTLNGVMSLHNNRNDLKCLRSHNSFLLTTYGASLNTYNNNNNSPYFAVSHQIQ